MFCSIFLRQKATWFRQDQRPLAQATKRVGMLLAIPTVIASHQPSPIQHIQSLAAAIVELTRQNQELTREINLRRQCREGYAEGQA